MTTAAKGNQIRNTHKHKYIDMCMCIQIYGNIWSRFYNIYIIIIDDHRRDNRLRGRTVILKWIVRYHLTADSLPPRLH